MTYDFLSLKTDVNLLSITVSNKHKGLEKNIFFVGFLNATDGKAGSGFVSQWCGPADPDSYQDVTDP